MPKHTFVLNGKSTTVDVEDDKGNVTNWSMEMGAPGALRGRGWDKNTLKIGEVVTVEATRAKDGGNHANARNVKAFFSVKRSKFGVRVPMPPRSLKPVLSRPTAG